MSEMVKRVAVGRFLGVDDREVQRMIDEDALPHTEVPGKERPGIRIFLPDFHAWLVGRSRVSERLKIYEEFRRAFFAAQEGRKRKANKTRAQAA